MTDEEKQRKKLKIEENRARKIGDAASPERDAADECSVSGSGSRMAPFSPFAGSMDSAKPQAVVVGVKRKDDGSSDPLKVRKTCYTVYIYSTWWIG